MATTSDYLNKLVEQRNDLATRLVAKGVPASTDETLETLVPKVSDIPSGTTHFGDDFPLLDGNTHFWIEKEVEEQTYPYEFVFNLLRGELTFYWGDGTSDTVTTTGQQTISHQYGVGKYRIDIVATGTWGFGSGVTTQQNQPSRVRPYYSYIELGNGVTRLGSQSMGILNRVKEIAVNLGDGNVCNVYNIVLQYATSLRHFKIYSGIIKQGNVAQSSTFSYNYSLTEIDMSNMEYTRLDGMFDYCYSLAKVTGLDGITQLYNNVFRNNYSLSKIVLPSSITSMNASVFTGDANLTDIYVPWGEDEVANAPWGATNATIHYNYTEGEV